MSALFNKNPTTHSQQGFTLVELITVITILGLLSIAIIPKLTDRSAFESRTIQDQLISAARQAQQLAMHKGNTANVQLITDNTNKRIRIQYTQSGTQIIDYAISATTTITNSTTTYNAIGDANLASMLTITIDTSKNVCIETTGYAHAC